MFILMTGWELFFGRTSHDQTPSHAMFTIVLGLVIWPTAGAVAGLVLWDVRESQKRRNQKPS